MVFLPWIITFLLIIGGILRYLWIDFNIAKWQHACIMYQICKTLNVALENAPEDTDVSVPVEADDFFLKAIETWPKFYILTYFWIWDFKHFIVNQDARQIIIDYAAHQQ